ncbi:MAG: phenylalanine--tRNA ligase subunit beta [Desulfobacterales bacterium]|nr:phenylalanine--tRNA ligase subunit beta [Desulfobacterales bacterium]
MKVSLNWLREYIQDIGEVNDITYGLTMAGLEVESVDDRYAYLAPVVAGKIIDIQPHPRADHLTVCAVITKKVGKSPVQIVCGAGNIFVDAIVPVAFPGTSLIDGSVLKEQEIRGVYSYGMLCSEYELGIGLDDSGVMILAKDVQLGSSIKDVFNLSDIVIDVSITPNRPDCLCIIGIAREIAAILQKKLIYPDTFHTIIEDNMEINKLASVQIQDTSLCPRYTAKLVIDISVEPSPFWLQDRLRSIGQRPINNIVDITNFVMMEMGQPLHAFDFDLLAGKGIVVRRALQNELFTTLDGKQRNLNHDMLMICDKAKPVAIAGVMGGMNSEIHQTTKHVLIESANFNPSSIRRTSKKLGLTTEATYRFERGVDPNGTVRAINRAAQLMVDIAKGKLISGVIDVYPFPVAPKEISVTLDRTNSFLGTNLTEHEIIASLESIEFQVNKISANSFKVISPTFRVDVSQPEDIIEEVARRVGYQHIPVKLPVIETKIEKQPNLIELRTRTRQILCGFGFCEVVNYSFGSKQDCDYLLLNSGDIQRQVVELLNPLAEEQSVMRPSLLPAMLGTIQRNITRQIKTLRIFEIGHVYQSNGKHTQPVETEMVVGAWTGDRLSVPLYNKAMECDFYDIKGIVESYLNAISIPDVSFNFEKNTGLTYLKQGYTAEIYSNQEYLGVVGLCHPMVLKNYGIEQEVYLFELNFDKMDMLRIEQKKYHAYSKYPSLSRDITCIVDHSVSSIDIVNSISELNEPLIEHIDIVDVYDQPPIPKGKKSISIRIVYQSMEKTLEYPMVNPIHQKIGLYIADKFQALFQEKSDSSDSLSLNTSI